MFEDTQFSFTLPDWFSKIDRVVVMITLVLIAGVALTGYGLTQLLHQPTVQANSGEILGVHSLKGSLYVDISGAVEKPGVYQLAAGDRLALALEKAGGLTVEADSLYVAKTLNLAQPLQDGEKVYIPWQGEVQAGSDQSTFSSSVTGISLNTATQTELETLPQVGEKRAQEIIQNRPYTTIDELVAKEIVSEALFSELKELIIL